MSNEIIAGDGIKLYKRVVSGQNQSKYWQVCVASKVGKKPFRRSLRTTNRKEAAAKAVQLATEFWDKEARGLPTTSPRFNKAAELLCVQLEADLSNGIGKEQYKENIRIVRNSFIPYFTTQIIGSIGIDDLRGYVEHRKEQRGGKEVSWSYQKNESAAWNALMPFAYERKWVGNKLTLPKVKAEEPTKRTKFTDAESRKVRAELRRLSGLHSKNRTTMKIRQFMPDYYLFLQNTGVRCGLECLRIKWSQFELVDVGDLPKPQREFFVGSKQEKCLRLYLRKGETKTGKERTVIVRNEQQSVTNALIRLAERNADTKELIADMPRSSVAEKILVLSKLFRSNEYVFRYADEGTVVSLTAEHQLKRLNKMSDQLSKAFTRMLRSIGLKDNKDGSVRCTYSVRHTYASKIVEDGCSSDIGAKQIGNLPSTFNKYYNHADVSSYAGILSGALPAKAYDKLNGVDEVMSELLKMPVDERGELIKMLTDSLTIN